MRIVKRFSLQTYFELLFLVPGIKMIRKRTRGCRREAEPVHVIGKK